MDDLSQFKKGDLLFTNDKNLFLIVENKQITINKVTLYDVQNKKEIEIEAETDRPLWVKDDLQPIPPHLVLNYTPIEFRKITLEDAEEWLLNPTELTSLKSKISITNNPNQGVHFISS